MNENAPIQIVSKFYKYDHDITAETKEKFSHNAYNTFIRILYGKCSNKCSLIKQCSN